MTIFIKPAPIRRLITLHSYGVLVVAEGNKPRFVALASKTTEADCLARHAIWVDGIALLATSRFYAKEEKTGSLGAVAQ